MAVDLIQAERFALQVERFYASLIRTAGAPGLTSESRESESGLGGKLLYAGELDKEARALLVAANIAGVASLAASADAAERKQALREGVVDFLVTSLDEALRILKNEIRKREPVAVCVALEPETVEAEMRERGVAPDLMRPGATDSLDGQTLLCWSVASSPAIWLPKLDAIALACLEENMGASRLDSETWDSARRWLRLAPRYLGRMAQDVRVLRCSESAAANFRERMREEVESGVIGVAVEIKLFGEGRAERLCFTPPGRQYLQ